ncbi:type II toxin-antitoxin system VapC family toxin [Candidatus Peregrinibacteria bacterium]|nr:type II toxin-antitoxin system VapC family toxin [Candidatus Peregrinibacteria bacterium]
MNILDSSAWLEYFADTKNAGNFSKIIENTKDLIVPTITIYEVFKKVLQKKDRKKATETIAYMKQGKIVDLNLNLSLEAVKLNMKYNLPMTDSIILATAKQYNATVWTQDADFKGIPGVKYFKKI